MRQFASCLLTAFSLLSMSAQISSAESSDVWQAQWIMPTDVEWAPQAADAEASSRKQAKANQWFCYRHQILLDDLPRSAQLRLACDSKYWLWINGKLIVLEGQLKRGPSPGNTYYDKIDLKPHLQQGENTIAVLLWYFGKHGFSHEDSGQPGLLFELDVDGNKLLSDATWRARRHPAFGETEPPHPNYRLSESNIHFDARLDLVGWQAAQFNDSTWPLAIEVGKPPCAPWNELVVRPIPQWRDFGLRNYENAESLAEVSTGKPILAKLPYNAQVTPYLKIDAIAGQKIDIRTDNYQGGSAPNVRTVYLTREGVQEFETPGWMNGHEVIFNLPPGVKIHELKYRETGYNTEFSGRFHCDDPALNSLWLKSQRTLYVTMRDNYMDCPDRERAQWWGDEVIELGEAFYALDKASHHLARKGILELANWQKSSGEIYSPVPAGNWEKELPTQMLASVGTYGFWNYYLHTGDKATIEAVYPAAKRYLDLWTLGADGLVVPRKGGWTWGDWGKEKDLPLLFNGWYYQALESLAKMAELTGHVKDAKVARDTRAMLRESFNNNFWHGNEYRSPQHQGQTDDRGNGLAVVAGLADKTYYPNIRKVLARRQNASPYMEKYVLESLFQMGYPGDAQRRMKQRYSAMIDSPLTTLWEGWGIGKAGFGGGTYNHAWSGGPLTLLSQFVAGIEPTTPGYREFAVCPQLGPLRQVEARIDSVAGTITIMIERTNEDFSLVLEVPVSTSALVTIPSEYQRALTVNGQAIPVGGKLLGVKDLSRDASSRQLRLQAGRWSLVAKAN